MTMLSRPRIALATILGVYLLAHCSQLAITPLGEGMDLFGHLSYVVFYGENGRAPAPDEPSVPAWIPGLKRALPGPDPSAGGDRYLAWATAGDQARQARREAALAAPRGAGYAGVNYEAQQPPLYYWLVSGLDLRLDPHLDLARRVFALAAFSECLVAIGLVGVYLTFRLYAGQAAAALALLALAWYPNLLAFFGRLTNDSLAFALMAWAILLMSRSQRGGSIGELAGAGGLLVLAAFAKFYALTLVPVYLLCAARPAGRARWGRLAVAAAISAGGVGWLIQSNLRTSGVWMPLLELRVPRPPSVAETVAALARVPPVWFAIGMARGFWWSGYWSFLSPGAFYYLPPLAVGLLLFKRSADGAPARGGVVRRAWPHLAALAVFLAAMAWHAAGFRMYADLGGPGPVRGNEGWYANVLLGSVFVVGLVLLADRLPEARCRSVLAGSVALLMCWNLVARLSLVAFWTGRARKPHGFGFESFRAVAGPGRSWWTDLASLPGVVGPLWLTCLLPLSIAIAASAALVLGLRRVG
jgi:hypothetical protein